MKLEFKDALWEPIVKEHPKSETNTFFKQTYGDDTHYGFVEPQENSEKYELKGLFPSSKSIQEYEAVLEQNGPVLTKKLTPPKHTESK